ncbi:MAG: RNA-binding S4 domain-containing protein [Clostridiales bacterium]|nr:RNA-binding S4 domain-containing protein [Clostridiales bacterium]
MRLDKFLKVSRLLKRRSIASEACSLDRIKVNGLISKAGKQLKLGDIITLRYGEKDMSFKVLIIPEKDVNKEESGNLYEFVDTQS